MPANFLNKCRLLTFLFFFSMFTTFLYSQSTSVQFNVNMKQQIALGNFKPATDFVDLSGTFNNWGSALLTDANKDSIYSTSITFNVGDNIQFKARINGLWNGLEEFPGGGPNRTYTVANKGVLNFWYSDNIPSYVLSAAFLASSRAVIPEEAVQFLDKSNGSPVWWEWTFPGGTPASSTLKNPVINYAAEGSYPVTLKIKSSATVSDSLTRSNFINVTKASTSWWNDAVFYEVFVRSFYDQNGDGKGDLKGLIAKLDYLNDGDSTTHTDLGVTALWLMPIMPSPSYHGYDVVNYRAINSDYGTNADFTTLIQEAHKRGIKVIIDLVMNHTSSQNPWFTQSAGSTSSSYRNWFRWSTTNTGGQWNYNNGAYYYAVFGSNMPDLNYAESAVKTEMFDVARYWLQDMHADGFRLDAVKYIFETATQTEDVPATFQFWKDFRAYYKTVNPNAFAVGEAWTSTDIIRKYVENNGLDYCFEFPLASALVNAANNGDASTLQSAVESAMGSYPYLQFGTFLTNHDQERVMTTLGNTVSKAKLAAQLLLSLPGIPFLYYGEEIGTIGSKPDENIRTPLQWNSSANAGFTSGTPWRAPQSDYPSKNIIAQQADTSSLWWTYNKMIQLRTKEAVLRRGNYTTLPNNSLSAFTFLRQYGTETIIVASNLSSSPLSNLQISLYPGTLQAGNYLVRDLLSGTFQTIIVAADGSALNQNFGTLQARSTVLYKIMGHSSGLTATQSDSFRLFPVPATDFIYVQLDSANIGKADVIISDMSGKILSQSQINSSSTVSVTNLQPGLYTLKVTNGKSVHAGKILIQR